MNGLVTKRYKQTTPKRLLPRITIQSIQIGTPTADSLRVYLADGIRTVIDVIIVVDEIEATPPAAMPLAA